MRNRVHESGSEKEETDTGKHNLDLMHL